MDLRNSTGLNEFHSIGCFSAMLPTQCEFSSVRNGLFDGLAFRIHIFCQAVFELMDVPLMGIIDRIDLGSKRCKAEGNPLFTTCFSFVSHSQLQKASGIDGVISDKKASLARFYEAAFDIWLGIGEMGTASMMGNLMYDATIFSRRSAASLLMSLKASLKQVVCKPNISLSAADEWIIKSNIDMHALNSGTVSNFDTNYAVRTLCDSKLGYKDSTRLWRPSQFLESGLLASSTSTVSDIGGNVTLSFKTVHFHASILASKLKSSYEGRRQPRMSLFSGNSWCSLIVHYAASLVGGIIGNHNAHLAGSEFAYQLKLFDPELVVVGAGDRLKTVFDDAIGKA